ncbi:uncharacterized membrane protein YjgN (DUF898 family) [Arthrobacter ginsengisoli]|uniref:Uncharacterized membrane protein YjgN (DUF898 family) n=1 Tax=Arthrobacter ginsengisoli TaxID=1356565 RepID=A0ABU1U7B6_9MICC|nr:DUF898 family protein [Arthrobacter ginsengisoli]MDR7081076.1 uncharacterized membrane protein YjgN (DUF898 family) [Arthrobacter ginsengisoli]
MLHAPGDGVPSPCGLGLGDRLRPLFGFGGEVRRQGVLITIGTIGICYPFAVVLVERWRAENTYRHGRQLRFIGTGWGIFGLWIKWLVLSIITLGIYTFWVYPRLKQWKVEKTVYA